MVFICINGSPNRYVPWCGIEKFLLMGASFITPMSDGINVFTNIVSVVVGDR